MNGFCNKKDPEKGGCAFRAVWPFGANGMWYLCKILKAPFRTSVFPGGIFGCPFKNHGVQNTSPFDATAIAEG